MLATADPSGYRDELRAIEPALGRELLARVNSAQALLERFEKLLTRAASGR